MLAAEQVLSDNHLYFHNDLFISDYFLWTDAAYGKAGETTALNSPLITSHENICFHFWFDIRV